MEEAVITLSGMVDRRDAELATLRAENERLREEMHHMIVRNQFLADNYGLIYSRQDQAKEALK